MELFTQDEYKEITKKIFYITLYIYLFCGNIIIETKVSWCTH